jgi:hypothetical protein
MISPIPSPAAAAVFTASVIAATSAAFAESALSVFLLIGLISR